MNDHGVMFSVPMVLALLAGRKTQTRRLATSPLARVQPSDRLWVRETFALAPPNGIRYPATDAVHELRKLKPAIHMPRWASRLTLLVTDVRVEPLQNISEADAIAEGLRWRPAPFEAWSASESDDWPIFTDPRRSYRGLWSHLHGPDSWQANPDVVALTFTVHRCNIDKMETPA